MDPRLDPNASEYEARLDPNSDQFNESARYDYDAQQTQNQSGTTDPTRRAPSSQGESSPAENVATPQAKPYTKETLWQQYAVDAINQIYPGLRNGVDFAWGLPADDPSGEPRLLGQAGHLKDFDMGKIQEAAQKMADADPYAFYEPGKPLHGGTILGQGEVRPRAEGERWGGDNTPHQVEGAPGSPSTPPVEPLPGGTPQ
jgi:hypothetical protein